MQSGIKAWIQISREKLQAGAFNEEDLDQLEQSMETPVQQILYLYSKSTNMRSSIAGWATYDAKKPHEPALPSQDAPYESVIDAVADGWHIVQFPIPDLYKFSDVDNQYLGYEFILEKWG